MTNHGRSPQPIDPVDRAHLTGVSRPTPPIFRYAPSAALTDLVQRFWIPVWSLPAPSTQSTLQHPSCLIVVSNTYARLYGVVRGCSSVTLAGDGWAVGTQLTPAAGWLIVRRSLEFLTDRYLDLADVTSLDSARLVTQIRDAMQPGPDQRSSHFAAIAALESQLAAFLPLDPEGLEINNLVAWLRDNPAITRVSELVSQGPAAQRSERSLQRLVERRLGLTPKWLIQRRRLHDAILRLKQGQVSLAEVAAGLGYTDQAHFTHDFRTVTGMTPGCYLADQPTGTG